MGGGSGRGKGRKGRWVKGLQCVWEKGETGEGKGAGEVGKGGGGRGRKVTWVTRRGCLSCQCW